MLLKYYWISGAFDGLIFPLIHDKAETMNSTTNSIKNTNAANCHSCGNPILMAHSYKVIA